jgi:hypothetical protein
MATVPSGSSASAGVGAPVFTAEQYLLEDYRHTLFPLSTTRLLVERFAAELREYARTNPFRVQTRCSAAKRGFHLRRTVKLDPPSELFLYDLIFRNRKLFRQDHSEGRSSYGFRFTGGRPVSSKTAYLDYRSAVSTAKKKYKFGMRFDISSYFNSLYHHDLVSRFREIGSLEDDVVLYGRFLREINSGRSLDCLPHGLHPCKVLGADFLKFVDNSIRLKSPALFRFLDDFNLFSEREQDIQSDFNTIQELLSEKGLFLNEKKTVYADNFGRSMTEEIEDIKTDLLRARDEIVDPSGIELSSIFSEEDEDQEDGEDNEISDEAVEAAINSLRDTDQDELEKLLDTVEDTKELDVTDTLSEEQVDYLLGLLNDPELDESDAELALVLLKNHGEDVLPKMGEVLVKFPSLSRTIYQFASFVEDKAELCNLVLKFLRGDSFVTEYQLFWITKMLEDHLSNQSCYGTSLAILNGHPSSTTITRAKLLEIPEHRFGMPDLREEALRSGRCDWIAWSAALGCRKEDSAKRNHLLGYFENGGPMNHLIGGCAKQL